ncbi:hypothetical protein IM697_38705 [Streptomyces ferrugineus]|uniref:Uncharacterized protein n=1 Tax=Streptomyces ferrugineus TaxID=1413221 RepID=A0A7M2SIQ0_9ACTN|nr:hypothetical protein [Streptomyces ferrugineus]QOV35909.1 hypothetical protein IM697_38705 [Streptomyces ferrugineus]
MGTKRDWVYRVDEPHGSQGWRPYGAPPERWRGTVITDDPKETAQYVAALVVTALLTEWESGGTGRRHVRVIVWADREGDGPEDAAFTVEIRPDAG